MKIASKKQIEQRLCSRLLSHVLNLAVRVELAARTFGPAFAFHLRSMVMALSHASHDRAVPSVPIPSLCEDGCAPIKANPLRATNFGASHVRLNNKFACSCCCIAPRDVRQNLVEIVELSNTSSILTDSPVFAQDAESKSLGNNRCNDERCFGSGWG